MPESSARRRLKFTLYHGFAASLVLHAILVLPFIIDSLPAPLDEPPPLVIQLQGLVTDTQTEQEVQQQTAGMMQQSEADATKLPSPPQTTEPPPPPEDHLDEAAEVQKQAAAPPEAPAAAAAPQSNAGLYNRVGANAQQNAQTIRVDQAEEDRLRNYIKLLSKKVQANLVYPDAGRRAGLEGTATVSFTILSDGQIRPESLKIVESSGQAKLDDSALKTIRASVPFDAPPREMTIAIAVGFGRKR